MRQSGRARVRQRGVVLAITLLVLLVLTVAGVSGMSASTVQLNLARNGHHKHGSFQNAESALLTGEIAWARKVSDCLNNAAHCRDDISPPVIDSIDSIEWDTVSGEGITKYGKYIVEYLGRRPVPGSDDTFIRVYRLTALGTSEDSTANTLLQSLYRICVRNDGPTCKDQGGD